MGASEETLTLLRSIDASLKQLVQQARGAAPAATANDRDLDGPHGDPVVRAKDPRDWTGDSMKGRHFSECPPEYLDLLAERFEYFAGQEQDPKKAKYNWLDAARARGWAQRIRSGRVPAGHAAPSGNEETGWGDGFADGPDNWS